MVIDPLQNAFASHPRRWRDFHYVYPVISRRSQGLSIGVNLNPDAACNFDCVYCCADRDAKRRVRTVNVDVLRGELRHLIQHREMLFQEPEFRDIPPAFRRLNDIAFSGDGEPTATSVFGDAVAIAAALRCEFGLDEAKLIVITNACFLTRPNVAAALRVLDANNGEIWAKLDAGTDAYFRVVNRARCTLEHVLENIRVAARERPLTLQSLFVQVHGVPPPSDEIEAYIKRLADLLSAGAQIRLVQVYTVARKTAESFATPVSAALLDSIGARVRELGLPTAVYH